ncbi:MAG: DUF3783 domain-containing protein [Clostridiaceae bacterium]
MLDNNNMILYYNLNKSEEAAIDKIVKEASINSKKEINSKMAKMTIKNIIDGFVLETLNESLPKDKLILFNNISDDQMNKAINMIKNDFSKRPILAAVTDTSINWTFEYLLEHLIEEREWYKNHSS